MDNPDENAIIIHGVLLVVFSCGVLLTGKSRIGKSSLALELIRRGHQLIADDAPLFRPATQARLVGTCPPLLQNFLAVPGLGAVDIRAIYGDQAIAMQHPLGLVIRLVPNLSSSKPLARSLAEWERLGIKVPEITLPLAGIVQPATLIEAAVQDHRLRLKGYDALLALKQKQRKVINSPPKQGQQE